MIIFDLDGTLANCEHRRHLVDPAYNLEYSFMQADGMTRMPPPGYFKPRKGTSGFIRFKPNWTAFYESCNGDEPIEPVIEMLDGIYQNNIRFFEDVQIWSDRCESVREKTLKWMKDHLLWDDLGNQITLKMRPIGDNTPDDQLKEKWLDEAIAEGKTIDFVVDDRSKVCRMWQRRGIFVFNVSQGKGEF